MVAGTENQGVFAVNFNFQMDGGKFFARIPLTDYSSKLDSQRTLSR